MTYYLRCADELQFGVYPDQFEPLAPDFWRNRV